MARSLCILVALLVVGGCSASSSSVSDKEIKQLTEKLFSVDKHALSRLVHVDLQGKTYSSATDDKAPKPLLSVNDAATKSANPSVGLLAALYDNYVPDCTVPEHETAQEKQEQSALLDALIATPVLSSTLSFLAGKGLVPSGAAAQKEFLRKLWFSLYSRGGGALGSSAFEHVFLGELKRGDVSGMHSWLFYNHEEEAGNVDYKGYIKKLSLGESGTLLKVRFEWLGANKPVNSLFVGASPELEMSLYTLCFLARPDQKCHVSANGVNFYIQTWSFKLRDGFSTIGSAYPAL
ncbi:Poly(U)-specific endoribonuclease-like protein [Frankliniella fusca]|uniref:Poly(U)-specific endoribonuclease-like protein n=1 Tax=Frankliniella fusca TaxID=407009 RepID=A0AAE1GUK4_9NEOP|nr:Poly(U)-specific endoribonuclease-like protein [Frankliniella fusca]